MPNLPRQLSITTPRILDPLSITAGSTSSAVVESGNLRGTSTNRKEDAASSQVAIGPTSLQFADFGFAFGSNFQILVLGEYGVSLLSLAEIGCASCLSQLGMTARTQCDGFHHRFSMSPQPRDGASNSQQHDSSSCPEVYFSTRSKISTVTFTQPFSKPKLFVQRPRHRYKPAPASQASLAPIILEAPIYGNYNSGSSAVMIPVAPTLAVRYQLKVHCSRQRSRIQSISS
ncbi:uncharacterized protein BDR25DRAFT_340294 [Lindgomyces ingoldianus]|uniref:Uncharacterized protein n=1 Tax=Lindgomyces ingoldianus TaxID=673940 RepID=A0ACB6R8G4_9PLEO|nr:uncharacterized protein BDR25DRAFT_340294 [Lindgomyces ingoldianus]KAF2475608.1 hypothetical protein BDR25DRAFT_340294 [Lindgomyces ingoldianus]